jgi:hypothetical protein
MARYFNVQRPPQLKFEDLKGVVNTRIYYNQLPYRMRTYQGDGRTEEVVFEDYLIDEKIDGAVFEEFRPKPKE